MPRELGFPVALKAAAPELVHKTDVGGVRLGLTSDRAVRTAFAEMRAALGPRMGGAIVQPMAPPGVELIVGINHDPTFGPLVLFGMGGFAAELQRDTALADPTAHRRRRRPAGALAARLTAAVRVTANSDPVDVEALAISSAGSGCSHEEVDEVAELDCNPVVVSPDGALVLDAKLRLVTRPTPPEPLRPRLNGAIMNASDSETLDVRFESIGQHLDDLAARASAAQLPSCGYRASRSSTTSRPGSSSSTCHGSTRSSPGWMPATSCAGAAARGRSERCASSDDWNRRVRTRRPPCAPCVPAWSGHSATSATRSTSNRVAHGDAGSSLGGARGDPLGHRGLRGRPQYKFKKPVAFDFLDFSTASSGRQRSTVRWTSTAASRPTSTSASPTSSTSTARCATTSS